MDIVWQKVGIVLAELVFAGFVALLTRIFNKHNIQGQTFSMVVLGVSGVVSLAGFNIGWEHVGFLSLCFSVAAIPMGIEYYSRVIDEQSKANEESKRLFDGHSSTDR